MFFKNTERCFTKLRLRLALPLTNLYFSAIMLWFFNNLFLAQIQTLAEEVQPKGGFMGNGIVQKEAGVIVPAKNP